ncbi:hypothetical protein RFI_27799 [Reticulomyxa filosa]|uniref:Uncharacterized protein n=1 Tax=Reticulomyxa filosa TaxID=46433 RepID=X6M6N8_RETFI|nr:hypothetical protein RFI_27799 [Reticulomyxa filosa]|eukprot:ETO09579.1 hypothetical protein RFI_27799 [Reticulomyxa filosa]
MLMSLDCDFFQNANIAEDTNECVPSEQRTGSISITLNEYISEQNDIRNNVTLFLPNLVTGESSEPLESEITDNKKDDNTLRLSNKEMYQIVDETNDGTTCQVYRVQCNKESRPDNCCAMKVIPVNFIWLVIIFAMYEIFFFVWYRNTWNKVGNCSTLNVFCFKCVSERMGSSSFVVCFFLLFYCCVCILFSAEKQKK